MYGVNTRVRWHGHAVIHKCYRLQYNSAASIQKNAKGFSMYVERNWEQGEFAIYIYIYIHI